MMGRRYRVGIIGLTPPASWAAVAHLPALSTLGDKFEVYGVANSTAESASAAATTCGIKRAFASPVELVADPCVDIVAVTVKVAHHLDLVKLALEAGKHVICEWPLGNGLEQSLAMAQMAAGAKVVAVCGTQAVFSPTIEYARDLISQGYVGEVLSSTVVADGNLWGPTAPKGAAYSLDAANGATMITVPLGHSLTGITTVLGDIVEVFAILATRRSSVRIVETGEIVPLKAPDQAIIGAVFEGGAPISLHFRGGLSKGPGFRWEIAGTEGLLEITGARGVIEMIDLTLSGAQGSEPLQILPVPDLYGADGQLGVMADNVRRLYSRMYDDLETGSRTAPSFDKAVQYHRILAAIEESAETGRRVRPQSM